MRQLVVPFAISAVFIVAIFLAFGQIEGYFSGLLDQLSHRPALHYYTIVSVLILASDILLPVPSSVVMFTNGFVLDVAWGSLVSLFGLQIGAVVGYQLGKVGSKWRGNTNDQNSQFLLTKYGPWAILLSRGIPILSESICMVCGYNQVPFKTYFILNIIGYVPICILYAICGSMGFHQDAFLLTFGASILVAALMWVFARKLLNGTDD